MKRVLVAGVVAGVLILAAPTLALSADRGHGHGGDHNSHSDDRDRHYRDGYGNDYYGPYGGPAYYYGRGYECHYDPSGSYTCEPYGGDWDPGGYNGGYPDPPPDSQYCSHPHSAHSQQCEEPRGNAGGPPPSGAPASMVSIKNLAFNPAQLKARPGDDVVWSFDDNGVAHTVTADNGSFDSGKRSSGQYVLNFGQPGTYSYHCTIHPKMTGKVVVG
jgi:plastocyanin